MIYPREWGMMIYTREWGMMIYPREWGMMIYPREWGMMIYTREWGMMIYTREWGKTDRSVDSYHIHAYLHLQSRFHALHFQLLSYQLREVEGGREGGREGKGRDREGGEDIYHNRLSMHGEYICTLHTFNDDTKHIIYYIPESCRQDTVDLCYTESAHHWTHLLPCRQTEGRARYMMSCDIT